jgi:hypothetical protein
MFGYYSNVPIPENTILKLLSYVSSVATKWTDISYGSDKWEWNVCITRYYILTSAGTELPLDYVAGPFIYHAISILLEGGHIPYYKCLVCDTDLKNIHMVFLV